MLAKLKLRLATVGAGALLIAATVVSSCGAATLPRFPNTTSGIHLAMVFDYRVPRGFGFRGVDAVWGATRPVAGRVSLYYVPFERDRDRDYSAQWWETNHPDWIEYRCDRTTWATEFGDPAVPLDIANPAVRRWQWSHEILPALQHGYQGVAFDNLNLTNGFGRCGHYDISGNWVNQYAGPGGLERYQHDVLSWAAYMRQQLRKAGRLMGMNYSYTPGVPWHLNLALMSLPNLLFDEGGVTNFGGADDNVSSYHDWQLIFRSAREIQRDGVCFELNGEEPQATTSIPLSEREWIISNYLLLKGRCTFVYISGFRFQSADGPATASVARVQDYGSYDDFPEYHLPIGAPLGPPRSAGGLWSRAYAGGLVVVDPSDGARTYGTGRALYALGTHARAKRFVLAAHTALILLRKPAM